MDDHHRNFSLPTTAKRSATPKRSCFGERESQENDQIGQKSQKIRKAATKNFMSPTVSAASKAVVPAKKILVERNESIEAPNSNSQLPDTRLHKPSNPEHNRTPNFNENLIGSNESGTVVRPFHELLSRASSDWEDNDDDDHIVSVFTNASSQRPYDPVTNYLSPRPTFLRYRPERRRQFLLLHQESKLEEAEIGASDVVDRSIPVDTEETTFEDALVGSPASSLQEDAPVKEVGEEINDEQEDEEDGEDEEDVGEEERWGFRGVLKTVLLGCVLLLCSTYISSMNSPTPSPASQAMASLRDGYSKVQKAIFEAVPWESFEFGNDFLGQKEGEEMVLGFVELNERGAIGEKDMAEAEPEEWSSRFEFDFHGQRETEEMHGFVEPSHWDFFEGVGEEEIVGGEIEEESSGFGIEFLDQREKEETGGSVHPNYRHYLYEEGGVTLEEKVEFEGEIKTGIVENEVVLDEVIEIMEFEATEMAENYDTNQASSTNSQEAVEVENKEAVENWDGFGEVKGDFELEIESVEDVSVQVVGNLELVGMESESLHDRQTPHSNLGDHCDEFSDQKDEMKPVEVMFGDANDKLGILEEISPDKPKDGTGLSIGMVNESTKSSVLEHMGTESVVLGVSMLFFAAFLAVLGVLYWCRRTAKNSSSSTAKMISETVMEEKSSNPLPIIERDEEESQIEKVVNSFTDYPVPCTTNSVEDISGDTYDDESRAPMVELLGEFMMEEICSPLSITDTVRRMSMTEGEENVSVSRDKKSLRSRGRPSRAHLDMSPSEFSSSIDSPSYGSFTSQKTMVKKEEGRNGETVLTPVRRSSRIRERGVSSR